MVWKNPYFLGTSSFSVDNLALSPCFFTTKITKDTKVSDIDISKLLNFVLFVTSFENTRLG